MSELPLPMHITENYTLNGNNTDEFIDKSIPHGHFLHPIEIAIALTCIYIADIFIITANIFVISAFVNDNRLRIPRNFYICNLALCDLVIGVFVVPIYSVTIVTGDWELGHAVCIVWTIANHVILFVSHLSIMLIAYDRFKLVNDGARYGVTETAFKAKVRIGFIWLGVITSKLLLILPTEYYYIGIHPEIPSCSPWIPISIPYIIGLKAYDITMSFVGMLIEVFVPLLMISIFHWQVLKSIKKRLNKKNTLHKLISCSLKLQNVASVGLTEYVDDGNNMKMAPVIQIENSLDRSYVTKNHHQLKCDIGAAKEINLNEIKRNSNEMIDEKYTSNIISNDVVSNFIRNPTFDLNNSLPSNKDSAKECNDHSTHASTLISSLSESNHLATDENEGGMETFTETLASTSTGSRYYHQCLQQHRNNLLINIRDRGTPSDSNLKRPPTRQATARQAILQHYDQTLDLECFTIKNNQPDDIFVNRKSMDDQNAENMNDLPRIKINNVNRMNNGALVNLKTDAKHLTRKDPERLQLKVNPINISNASLEKTDDEYLHNTNYSISQTQIPLPQKDRPQQGKTDHKAAVTITLLIIFFVLFKLPLAIALIHASVCPGCVGVKLFQSLLWIFWAKSIPNPFLYAFISKRFRSYTMRWYSNLRNQFRRGNKFGMRKSNRVNALNQKAKVKNIS